MFCRIGYNVCLLLGIDNTSCSVGLIIMLGLLLGVDNVSCSVELVIMYVYCWVLTTRHVL